MSDGQALSERQLAEAVIQAFRERIIEKDYSNLHVRPEPSLLSYFMLFGEFTEDSFGLGRAELIISRELDWVPSSIDTVEELDRWFPENSLGFPVAVIEFSINPPLSSASAVLRDTIGELGDRTSIRPIVISAGVSQFDSGLESGEFDIESFHLPNIHHDTIVSLAVDPILEDVMDVAEAELISDLDVDEKMSRFDPEVFHFNEVLRAYTNGRNKILIILLSVFFERYVHELREETLVQVKENPRAGDFVADWSFKRSLDACRFFDTVSESDYGLINRVRDARNAYAHELDSFHDTHQTEIERAGQLEDAIQLYEDLIGVKQSMLGER